MIKVLASVSQGRAADVDVGIDELLQAMLEFEHGRRRLRQAPRGPASKNSITIRSPRPQQGSTC
jgi:hypothetical protein